MGGAAPAQCASCGATLKSGARFCESCGKAVGAAPAPAAVAAGQYSADGLWWWDGAQWVAVAAPPVAPAPPTVGQLSRDQRWRWNGRGWMDASVPHTQYFPDGSQQGVDAKGKAYTFRTTNAQGFVMAIVVLVVAAIVFWVIIKHLLATT